MPQPDTPWTANYVRNLHHQLNVQCDDCRKCGEVDLDALIDAGRGDEPIRMRCSCGSRHWTGWMSYAGYRGAGRHGMG